MGNSTRDRRPAIIVGDIAKIPLGVNAKQGYAIVDKDFAWIDKYNWVIGTRKYPVANVNINGKRKSITMHRLVVNAKPLVIYDHINRDRLDNRLSNLRECTQALNSANRAMRSNNKSGFKGIRRCGNLWYSQIVKDGVSYRKGRGYKTKVEAAKRYDELAIELFGEFAALNFPEK